MIEGSLSRRYAKALFQLALEAHREEEVKHELERFLTAYTTPPLPSVLNNPAFHVRRRKAVLMQVAASLELTPLVAHFLSLALDRDRLILLPAIFSRYRRLLDDAKGQVEAQVVSAEALEGGMIGKLRDVLRRVSGKEVMLQEKTDPGLIGGVVVNLEGKIYDGSVRIQLQMMRARVERGY